VDEGVHPTDRSTTSPKRVRRPESERQQVVLPGHDGGVGVRQGLGQVGDQVVGERRAVVAPADLANLIAAITNSEPALKSA
jgi:hypothetical protein